MGTVTDSAYSIEVKIYTYQVKGPFTDEMHSRIKRAGGSWLSAEKCWCIAQGKCSLEKLQTLVKKVNVLVKDKLAKEKEAKAQKQKALEEAKALEVPIQVHYHESDVCYKHRCRWDNVRKKWIAPNQEIADKVLAITKPMEEKRLADTADFKAKQEKEREEKQKQKEATRHLFFMDNLPNVGSVCNLNGSWVTITNHGKTFRYDYEQFGCWIPEKDGDRCCYGYFRPSTEEEIAIHLKAKEEFKEKLKAKKQLEEISQQIRSTGERPEKANPTGVRLEMVPQNLYGRGNWFICNPEEVWFIQNNGADGDDWSYNNVQTGGAGAIGWLVRSAELSSQVTQLHHQMSKGDENV